MTRAIAVLLALYLPVSASAMNVFACEPEWAALVKELARDNVENSADPICHYASVVFAS